MLQSTLPANELKDKLTGYRHYVYNGVVSRCSAAGSALALGARCRGFESLHLDHEPRRCYMPTGFVCTYMSY